MKCSVRVVSKRWSHAGRISELVMVCIRNVFTWFAGLVKFRVAHTVEQMNKFYFADIGIPTKLM